VRADVLVIGGGPNGLTAAALLAKAGLKTVVLERRESVGGAAVTEEFHPGFRTPRVPSAPRSSRSSASTGTAYSSSLSRASSRPIRTAAT